MWETWNGTELEVTKKTASAGRGALHLCTLCALRATADKHRHPPRRNSGRIYTKNTQDAPPGTSCIFINVVCLTTDDVPY